MSYNRKQFETLIADGIREADRNGNVWVAQIGRAIIRNLADYDEKNGSYSEEIAVMPVSPLISEEEKERKYGKRPGPQ